jgi:hypothetical protein
MPLRAIMSGKNKQDTSKEADGIPPFASLTYIALLIYTALESDVQTHILADRVCRTTGTKQGRWSVRAY